MILNMFNIVLEGLRWSFQRMMEVCKGCDISALLRDEVDRRIHDDNHCKSNYANAKDLADLS